MYEGECICAPFITSTQICMLHEIQKAISSPDSQTDWPRLQIQTATSLSNSPASSVRNIIALYESPEWLQGSPPTVGNDLQVT